LDPAMMIRMARHRAGLTQSQLATRAGTSAPTVSAYEHGARQPRADVLLRLLAAAGVEPVLVPSSTGDGRYVDLFCDELADRVRRDPSVLERARTELDRMRQNDNVRAWRSLLEAGPAAVVAVLTSRDPDTSGLKADNPFARLGLVGEDTRLTLLDRARGR
jgi:transcriptional regulator with XRE-family HTH domain